MKATKLQIQTRVEELLRIRLDGAEIWDIREYVRERVEANDPVWGDRMLTDSQLYRYCQRAEEQVAESCRGSHKRLLRRHRAERRNLYAKAVSQGDVRAALAVLDSEAKLLDLFPQKDSAPSAAPGVVIISGVDVDAALGRKPAGPTAAPGTGNADEDKA